MILTQIKFLFSIYVSKMTYHTIVPFLIYVSKMTYTYVPFPIQVLSKIILRHIIFLNSIYVNKMTYQTYVPFLDLCR